VRIAILVALTGYGLVTVGDLLIFAGEDRSFALATKAMVLVAGIVALFLLTRGRVRMGAGVTLAAVWVELHSAFPLSGLNASSLIVMPVLVSAGGMLVGGRAGFALAGLTSVTMPAVAVAGMISRGEPIVFGASEAYLWVITVAAMFASASLVQLGLESFMRVLAGAQASERRMTNLQHHAHDGMVATDREGRIVSVNPRAEALIRSARGSLVGRSLAEALQGVCEDEEPWRWWSEISLEGGPVTRTLRGRDENGERLWLETQASLIPWADGSVGLQLTLRDITGQERAAENERALRAQLEHAQRLEAVGRLAAGVAHEFDDLLTVVGGAAELLLADAKGAQAELAADILAAKLRGAALTRQLLAFARKDRVQPRCLSLTGVVRDLEPLLRRFVPDGVALDLDLTTETAAVVADQSQVEQVLVNLVVNARDAVGTRGVVTVGVTGAGEQRSFLDRTWRVAPETVELWVEDSGCGMDAQTRARVFEPFFTTKPRGHGAGLGLSTVHGIVSQNGGTLEVMSEPGKGAVFLVRWPVSPEA
jgi:PAS domain S-box-containing protein